MKHLLIILTCAIAGTSSFAQLKTSVKTKTTGSPAVMKPMTISRVKLATDAVSYKTDKGEVKVSYARSRQPKDDTKSSSSVANAAMCLTKEEVSGQKVENEIVIADGSKAVQILPGGVIDGEQLLNSGEFIYMRMDDRKPISISTTTNLAKVVSGTVNPGRNNNNVEEDLRAKVHALTRPSNMTGMPNVASTSEATVSTFEEKIGLNIGASFFFLGVSAKTNFTYSSEKFRYMYLYQFEQACLPVIANTVSSPADLFKGDVPNNNNWLYIREVVYGRRLYVLIESEYDLAKYSSELKGKLDWAAVSGAYKQKINGQSLSSKTFIRITTQGGSPVAIANNDYSKLQDILDNYFRKPFGQMDIVPLSFKLTYMDGAPVSVVSDAFLNGKNCLDKEKIRVRIKRIDVKQADNAKKQEEIYGSAKFLLYNTDGKVVMADGKTQFPAAPIQMFTGSIGFGSKETPLSIGEGHFKAFDLNEQGKYIDCLISNLDMSIQILPYLHEKDNVFNKDDDMITENRLKKTFRQLLLEGSTNPVFEFRHKNSIVEMQFEIIPLY